ncbi:MAG: T9SS type A sorting domain-containing protein [Bacteroidales bacterium]|nr:T9SS type A sorting domain-containing protein [Bacteroidales bacterium]
MRYLVNNDIISTDINTIIATKTDNADKNCIVPNAEEYIPSILPKEKRTEEYGLRYTIRCNGKETYMIITNPLNISINVTLNFQNISNPQIQNAIGVYFMFEDNSQKTTSILYKTDRESNINLQQNTVEKKYYKKFTKDKKLNVSFGPLDVKIIKFISDVPQCYNGWQKVWSNFGNGKIDGHFIKDNDIFYTGDFDGDGTEELLCINFNKNSAYDWITLLKYSKGEWIWRWSNYGNSDCILYPYRNNFIIGDFDGDGKDELLGNDINGWTTLFKLDGNDWRWMWSDYGKTSHIIRPYKNKIYAGDFDGDGKVELLGCDIPNGWTTMFKWSGNDFIWFWSDYGSNHAIRPYRKSLIVGDFDGDGKDDLLGFGTWTTMFEYRNNTWSWSWSNYGTNNFSIWSYPFGSSDIILSGNINLDNKEEILLLQTGNNASHATIMNLSNSKTNWNQIWSTDNGYTTIPYLCDWELSTNKNNRNFPKYFLMQIDKDKPKYLIAMRKYCSQYLVNMYSMPQGIKPLNVTSSKETYSKNLDNYNENKIIDIYPNPSLGNITIYSDSNKICKLQLWNVSGVLVFEKKYDKQQYIQENISSLSNGIYFIKIFDSNNVIYYKKLTIIK